jgi:hypothetical protein
MPTTYADLEIGLSRRDDDLYAVELRFTQADSDADIRLSGHDAMHVHFDREALRRLKNDPDAYGRALTTALFADNALTAAFERATATAQASRALLRVRLFIDASAPELYLLRWETLRDPRTDDLLLTNEQILFSRYLSSQDWRPIQLRSRADLRALVLIANPSDLADYEPDGQTLTPFDVAGELARVREELAPMPITAITERGTVTLNTLSENLRDGYDILYLIAHGAFVKGEPYLWLENEDGTAGVVPGRELVTRIREQIQLPRMIVLGSCQSAGSGDSLGSSRNEALTALGPRLAETGVPAVIAMQGNVAVSTLDAFMAVFFREMQEDGQIDRAVAAARSAIRSANDWWMPVLYMRLKSGRIWYVPGFGEEGADFEKWPALIRNIQRSNCTPILGPRLTGTLPGSTNDIAVRWAEEYNFPLAPHQREDLPQVAQYLAVSQDFEFPRDEMLDYLRRDLLACYRHDLPAELQSDDASLEDLFAAVGEIRRERNEQDPYKVLADMPLPIYVSANFSNLMTEALIAAGKDPQVEICRWNEDLEHLPSIYDDEPDYQPSVERPLVYHLFGYSAEPDTLVITEDDYFDYLMGVTANKDLIPIAVRRALADTGLLFLGFQLDDWSFRVLFRSLIKQEGRGRRKRYAHVAAQISPDETRLLEPERARRYLEQYFQDSSIDIYWGSIDDFVKEFMTHYEDSSASSSRRERRRRR